jgi:SHS2 domain-containing protein
MSFTLREHTADVAVEARGPDLSAVFGAVADGLAAAMCDDVPQTGGERFAVTVSAESREALLFDYLDELIYERDVREVLPVDNEAAVSETSDAAASAPEPSPGGESTPETSAGEAGDAWSVEATARGIPLADVDAREVKAVTYSEMRLEPVDDGWEAYVVFDV